jgi:hypothetical protein
MEKLFPEALAIRKPKISNFFPFPALPPQPNRAKSYVNEQDHKFT